MHSEQKRSEKLPNGPRISASYWSGGISRSVAVVSVCLIGIFFFFYGITRSDLYKTEGNRAVPAVEMIQRGAWSVPWLYGRPYLAKPPAIYVAIKLASFVLGGEVTVLSARLPSAVAALVTVLAVFFAVSRKFGPSVALSSALMLCMSYTFIDKSISADIEMLLVAFVTLSVLSQWIALEFQGRPLCYLWWVVSYLFVAAGFLTKGPPAVIFFYCALLPWLVRTRNLKLLISRAHIAGLLAGVLIVSLWVWAVVRGVGWTPLLGTGSQQTVVRFIIRWKYPLEAILHPLRIAALLVPWSAFALLGLSRSVRETVQDGRREFLSFLWWFVAASVVFWSLLPAHPIRYCYPVLPAIAILAGTSWHALLRADRNDSHTWRAFKLLNLIGAGTAAAVAGSATVWAGIALRHCLAAALLPAAAAVLGALVIVAALLKKKKALILAGWLLVWLAVKVAFVNVYMPERSRRKSMAPIGIAIGRIVPERETLHVFRNWHQSMLFYARRDIRQWEDFDVLPPGGGPFYVLLTPGQAEKWSALPRFRTDVIKIFTTPKKKRIVLALVKRTDD